MPRLNERTILPASLAASLLIHLAAAALLATRQGHDDRRAALVIAVDPSPPSLTDEEKPVRPGIDASKATSITWIGFDEYREHLARAGRIDQPELTVEATPAEVAPFPDEQPPAGAVVADAPPPVVDAPSTDSTPTPPLAAAPGEDAVVPLEVVDPPALAEAPLERIPHMGVAPPRDSAEDRPPRGGSPLTDPGRDSDRESQAASVLTAEWRKLGQPIAGEGIEILTRRPRFTKYTTIVGAMRDPLVRIHFRRDGTVDRVELVRSSGNPDVDRPVLDALYQWRARGRRLDSLHEGSPRTISLDFRILM